MITSWKAVCHSRGPQGSNLRSYAGLIANIAGRTLINLISKLDLSLSLSSVLGCSRSWRALFLVDVNTKSMNEMFAKTSYKNYLGTEVSST